MIKIYKEGDVTFLNASVTDFADSLGYCEYKIPLSIKGIRPRPTQSLILGIKAHHAEEKYEKEHVEFYKLPTDYRDLIIYTGFAYSGRNLILTRASDAVIIGCGRMGTVNEFTIAFEDKKPIGVLQGDWETDEVLTTLIEKSHRADEVKDRIVFESDPKILLDKLIKLIEKDKKENHGAMSFRA